MHVTAGTYLILLARSPLPSGTRTCIIRHTHACDYRHVSHTTCTCPMVPVRALYDTPLHGTAGTYLMPLARAQWYPYVPSTTHPCMYLPARISYRLHVPIGTRTCILRHTHACECRHVSHTTYTCPMVPVRAFNDTPMHGTAGTYLMPLARAQWYPYVPSTTHPCMGQQARISCRLHVSNGTRTCLLRYTHACDCRHIRHTACTCPMVPIRAFYDTPMHVTAGTYLMPLARAQWYPYVHSTTLPCI